MNRPVRLLLATILLMVPAVVCAGTFSLQWDPPANGEVAGYILYYGTTSGGYEHEVDVGNVTSHTVENLENCRTWYFAVASYSRVGGPASGRSDEISGWPRPESDRVLPRILQLGRTYELVITGTNFRTGALIEFDDDNVSASETVVRSCTEMVTSVTLADTTPPGALPLFVVNTDRSYGQSLLDIVETMLRPDEVDRVRRTDTAGDGS